MVHVVKEHRARFVELGRMDLHAPALSPSRLCAGLSVLTWLIHTLIVKHLISLEGKRGIHMLIITCRSSHSRATCSCSWLTWLRRASFSALRVAVRMRREDSSQCVAYCKQGRLSSGGSCYQTTVPDGC